MAKRDIKAKRWERRRRHLIVSARQCGRNSMVEFWNREYATLAGSDLAATGFIPHRSEEDRADINRRAGRALEILRQGGGNANVS